MFDDRDGEAAVRLARWAVEDHLRVEGAPRPELPGSFSAKGGAFVTLERFPGFELRGCIGYPEPALALQEAIAQAAIASCHDPRFPPLSPEEALTVVIEVSLLTPLELVRVARPLEYPKAIQVGRDGIEIRHGMQSGLLLPQVPTDNCWETEEFLSQGCMKAGLLADAWLEPLTQVYRFQAEVFREEEPRGSVTRRGPHAIYDGHRR